jgi:hypothetical protein
MQVIDQLKFRSFSATIGGVADTRYGVVPRGQPIIAVISFVSGNEKLFKDVVIFRLESIIDTMFT